METDLEAIQEGEISSPATQHPLGHSAAATGDLQVFTRKRNSVMYGRA